MAESLFSCTKCHHKFPFSKLSGSLMKCSGCREGNSKLLGSIICTYCREEYAGGGDSSSICPKCHSNVKQYGKPRACEVCNVIAAFIGNKCKRCVVSETKWGSPVICDQCKQKCAFNRDAQSKQKVDHKVLCWLCTIAYKRVLSKARKKENASSLTKPESRGSQGHKCKSDAEMTASRSHSHRPEKHASSALSSSTATKKSKTTENLNGTSSSQSGNNFMHDMNIVLVTQLREEVEVLKKNLAIKEKELFEKERKMTEFKTEKMETDKAFREKIITMQSSHSNAIDIFQKKNNELLKQIATLSKANKRGLVGSAPSSNNGSPASKF